MHLLQLLDFSLERAMLFLSQRKQWPLALVYSMASGEASSDKLVMQNALRLRKYDPACALQSCSRSMSDQPIVLGYINASISDYYLLLRCCMELKNYHCQGKLVLNVGY